MTKKIQPSLPAEGMEQGAAYDANILEERENFTRKGNLKELDAANEIDQNEHKGRSLLNE